MLIDGGAAQILPFLGISTVNVMFAKSVRLSRNCLHVLVRNVKRNEMIENNVTFLILCPELNVGGLRSTVNSIKSSFPEIPYICMVGENADSEDVREFTAICPVVKAGNTITSLINAGVKKSKTKWTFVIMAGCLARYSMFKKYNTFLKNEKDVLYSVVDKNAWLFHDATINGMLLSKTMLKEVGDFPDIEHSILDSKTWWGASAIQKGYKLKGIVGTKL